MIRSGPIFWKNRKNKKGRRGFPGGSDGKASAHHAGDLVLSLGQEDPLEKRTATHSSILAWKIPRTEEFMGSQRIEHNWVANTHKGRKRRKRKQGISFRAVVLQIQGQESLPLGILSFYRIEGSVRKLLSFNSLNIPVQYNLRESFLYGQLYAQNQMKILSFAWPCSLFPVWLTYFLR